MECFFENDKCVYLDNHIIQFITTISIYEENYKVKIFSDKFPDSDQVVCNYDY